MIVLQAMETRVGLVVVGARSSDVVGIIEEAWRWCLVDAVGEAPDVVLTVGIGVESDFPDEPGVVVRQTVPDLMAALTPRVTIEAINAQAGHLLMLHACGLAHPETGAVVALVGRSGMGKTTLAGVLGKTMAYVSDETVGIRSDFTVAPFPKPLSLKRPAPDMTKDQKSPLSLKLQAAAVPLWLGSVVLLRRDSSLSTPPRIDTVPLLQGVMELTPEISHLPQFDLPLQILNALASRVDGIKQLSYREASSAAPLVRELVGFS
ncbi:hypothetical protein QCD70_15280 [Agreia sp. PsM10]|uniref:hypothetical protein n=1 Tax=Agreia sp. PsM10 TaxID=3030533 RepID=UPI00263A735C|nr:hypothetical protein [Agreia sp. PsM10]MDN4641614.1 hypothetical protein [Agreia sp. PsM10]